VTERKYIAEYGAVTGDINSFIEDRISGGNMIAMYTEKFECSGQGKITDSEHLLEVRIFTDEKEIRIMRPTIDDDFSYRLIDDTNGSYEFIDEEHYLDIDTTKSSGTEYTATGGGKYTLPLENAERVLIRNYISYDEQGLAQITDFRVVKYLKRGDC
jgi:CRISPR-associated protein (TIGR03984 family)